ncbi:MAG: RagB/SusD family nutrient uptake outer membrane protein [Bacteroidetes bacterium]|nr:RagB/SusD family nutrient uptake outer membrane protein [Bacteroidota bacterium]
MKTNKLITRILGLSSLLVVMSCSNLLDLQPQTALSDATAFATPERIELTVAGMYDAAQSGFYLGGAVRGYPFGAAHIEQGDNRGEDVVNTQAFYQLTYASLYDGTTANNDYMWQTLFALINKTNVVAAGLETVTPTGTLTQAAIDAYKGETKLLRALAYMELVKHFCRPYWDNPTAAQSGMPYRKTAITNAKTANEATSQGRATVAENYADILADLNYAESVLPSNAGRTGGQKISRATKAAAIALKTRVYLNMRDWANVIVEGNKLASQASAPFSASGTVGTYSLTASPFGPFTSANSKSNTESIFSIENDVTDNPGVNGALPSMYNTSVAPTSGRALVAISPYIWNQSWWNATDIRKTSTMVNINVELTSGGGKGGYFTKKYSDVVGGSDNAPIIRYAEVLLNLAEAIQRQNTGAVDPKAFALYNAVRSRANAAGTDTNYDQASDFVDGNALLTAIFNERRIEFLCEGLRWMDITRLAAPADAAFNTWGGGIPKKVSDLNTNLKPMYTGNPADNNNTSIIPLTRPAIAYSNYKFLWPIPVSEVTLNPTLAAQQNPGW